MTEVQDPSAVKNSDTDVDAVVNYAGAIQGRARFDLVNSEKTNLVLEPRTVRVTDVRNRAAPLLLADAGFQFVKHRSRVAESPEFFEANLTHQFDATALNAEYEDELCALLKSMLGARDVFPQHSGLIVRTSDRAERKSWAGAAGFVHLDFTEKSAELFLGLTRQERGVAQAPYRRMMMIQTWRALSPGPQDSSLAICDGSTIPPEDAVFFDSHIGAEDKPGNVFESRLCKFRESHQWYYLSNMEPDDLLLFKGFDSDYPDAMNAMHSAFDNPLGKDGPPRRSVEARFFVMFE